MVAAKALLICAGILSLDVSLFQAAISLSPRLSAAFDAPPDLVANPPLLLAAGILVSIVFAICGLYALSAAGLVPRLPLLRLGLLGSGVGYLLMGLPFIPQLLSLTHVISTPQSLYIEKICVSLVALATGFAFLGGLAFGWKHLSASAREAPRSGARQAEAAVGRMQDQNPIQG